MTSPLFPGPSTTRRTLFKSAGKATAVLAAAALTLSACSTGPATSGPDSTASSSSSSQFPVTIEHVYGKTIIEKQPKRVATVSWVNDDVSIALGVVPVGVPKNEWGGNDQGSTPWKDEALKELGAGFGSDEAPVQYSEADGINFTEIAKLTPDVILAAYSGLTEEDYKKLSEIAPVVAHPELAYGTSWQDATTIIGKALGKDAEAAKLVSETEATVKEEAAKYPQIAGKTFIYGYALPSDPTQTGIYTANDNRPKFLSSIGMKLAPVAEQASAGSKEFFVPWSAEKVNELESDIFLSSVEVASDADAIKSDPLLGQIPAVKKGAFVADANKSLVLAISASSPLSLPWALDTFLPELATAADAAK
ncbi:iron complex transport system substrate-binding protein [Pseudarthrobacter sp. W1I19]|uniref:iron-siderophore ABC transporter substrate-binding protein n=1 Tax=Pseudarthrobacter sp. W1I19 TaxID=3042288 RepID=UPI00277E1228|nr:iron-siderophore ABC transporter substrate-binding protein [Pseudarthrobacter sp. W1I19]MDQ0925923.1 iron complex transport system substrate-binding protein [Pseudarthrobacter sp. W1I19]